MKIERIISFANAKVRLEFQAMERSLRATGCDLPLLVIPFDDNLFELPNNAKWLRDEVVFTALSEWKAVPQCRKLISFFMHNAAFFDADIIHLENPSVWLQSLRDEVFVVADTEWNKARWTFTPQTKTLYLARTTLWSLSNFNSGFFAYSQAPAQVSDLIRLVEDKTWRSITKGVGPTKSEQECANLLVHLAGVEVVNLCLPPYRMESTMACDYPVDFVPLLRKPNGPAFIHYAGPGGNLDKPIARLIFEHLTTSEGEEMRADFELRKARNRRHAHWPLWIRVAKRVIPFLDSRFSLQWADNFDQM